MADRSISVSLDFTANTNQAESALKSLQSSLQSISNMSTIGQDARMAKNIEEASAAAMKLRNNLQAAFDQKTGSLNLSKLNEEMAKSGMSAEKYRTTLSAIGPQGRQAFMELANAVVASETPLRQTTGLVDKLWDSLKRTAGWQLSSSMIHGFMGAVQSAYGYAQDLNKSLNNIRIVTGASTDEMARFAEQANKAAKGLSTTTTDYTDAALIYYQQGIRDQSEIEGRVATTIKLANVSGQSAEEVSSQMTAIWNNFDDGSKSLEYYADVITALGAATASSSQEISQGLSKFAAVADTVGMSYEYATSALATIVATTRQSADTVGTGLRTLFSRLQGLKLGETLEDGVDLNKYSKALEAVGVQALDASGELRNMDDILDDLGERWGDLSKAQQVALAQTVGGVRQYTNLVALMDNWDFMKENVGIASGAEGALQKQADIYAESWEAAKTRVRAAAEGIYDDLLDDKFFINMTKLFAGLLETIDKVIDAFGGLGGTLPLIFTLMNKIFGEKIQAGAQQLAENIYYSTKKGKAERDAKDAETKQSFVDQTKAMAQDSGASANEASVMATGYEKITALQTEMIAKNKTLTEEERNLYKMAIERAQILTQQTAELGKQADKAQAAADKEKFDLMTGTDQTTNEGKLVNADSIMKLNQVFDSSNTADLYALAPELEKIMGLEEKSIHTASDFFAVYEEFAAQYGQLTGVLSQDLDQIIAKNKELASGQNFYEKVQQGLKSIQGTTDVEKARAELEKLAKQAGATGEAIINDLGKKTKPTIGDIEQAFIRLGAGVTKSNENIESNVKQLGQKIGQAYGFSKEEIEKFIQTTLKAAQAEKLSSEETERLKTSLQSLSTSAGQAGNSMSGTSQKIANVLGAANKFGQAAMNISMAVGAIRGISDALNSTDMSPLEKMMSIFMSMGMLIPVITSGINGLVGIIKAINGVTIISTGLTVAETIAQTELAKAISNSTKKDLERYATRMLCNGATEEKIAKDLEDILLTDENITSINAETKALIKNTAAKLANAQAGKGVNSNLGQEGADIVEQTMLGGGKNAGTNVFQGLFGNLKGGFAKILTGLKSAVLGFGKWLFTTVGGWVTIGVAAIIATYAIIKSASEKELKDAQAKLESAQKVQKEAEENYKKQQENYNTLKSTGEEYIKLRDSLKGITKGTAEWYETTAKLNDLVSQLVKAYPQLALPENLKTVDGRLTLSNQAIEEAQKGQAKIVANAQHQKNLADIATLRAQQDLTTTQLGYDLGGTVLGIKRSMGRQNELARGAAYEGLDPDRGGGKETMEDLISLVRQEGASVLDNRKELATKLHLEDKDLNIIGLDENKQAIIDAANQVSQADASIQALTEVNRQLIKDQYSGNDDAFGKASDSVQDAVVGALEVDPGDYLDYYRGMDEDEAGEKAIYWMNKNEAEQGTGVKYQRADVNGKSTLQKWNGQSWENVGEADSMDTEEWAQLAAENRAQVATRANMNKNRNEYAERGEAYSNQLNQSGVMKSEDVNEVMSKVLAYEKENGGGIVDAAKADPSLFSAFAKYSDAEMEKIVAAMDGTTKQAVEQYMQSEQYQTDRKSYVEQQQTDQKAVNKEYLGESNENIGSDLLDQASQGSEQAVAVLQQLQEEYGLTEEKAREYLAAMAEASDKEDPFGADKTQKALMDEASAFTSLSDETKELDTAIKKFGKDSEEAAKAQDKLDKSLKSIKWSKFAKDAGKYIDTINEGADPEEMEKAYQGLADGLNEIFDTSVTKEWVNENMDAIKKLQQAALSGDEKAVQQAALELEMLANLADSQLDTITLDIDGDGAVETITGVGNVYDALKEYIQSGKISIDAEGHADLSQLVNSLINAGATGEEVARVLAAIGQTEVDFSGAVAGAPAPPGKIDITSSEGQAALSNWIKQLGNTKVDLNVTGGAVPNFSPSAMKNLGGSGGKGGGGGGGGGGGSKKTKEAPEEDRSSRYHSVNQSIKNLERKQDTTDRRKDRAFGKAEVELQKESIQLQKERIQLQQEYVRQISETLEKDRADMLQKFSELELPINLDFDEASGEISNYEDVINALFEKEKALVDQYNAGGLDDEAYDEAKKKIDKAKETLKNYEETLELQKDELGTLAEQMEELADKALELTEIKFELNMSVIEDQLEWLDYSLEKLEDDAYGAAKAIGLMGQQTAQYLKQSENAQNAINEILGRHGVDSIEQLNGLNDSQIEALGFNKDEIEALKKYRSKLYESNQALLEMRRTITDRVIDTFDTFNEKVQESYEEFDKYNDILEKYNDIVDLLGVKTDSATKRLIKTLRETQLQNLRNQSTSAKEIYEGAVANYDLAKKQYENAVTRYGATSIQAQQAEEIMKNAQEAMEEGYSNWLDAYQAALEKANEIYEEAMEDIAKDFEASLTNIYGTFDLFDAAYERAKELKDDYIPEYEKIYELNKLNRDIQKEIDNSSSLRDRKALRQLQEEINRKQEAGVQLSKYEVEEMRKKFELEQARMNLEDARNNKSEVRLTRDQNGNWGYVYTAAEDKVADAEQKYEDALYNYQKLSDDYINDLDEKIKDLTRNTQERLDEVSEALKNGLITADQAALQRQEILNTFYTQQNYLISQFKGATDSLSSSLGLMNDLYGRQAELVDTFPETVFGQVSGAGSLEEWANKSSSAVLKYAEEGAQAYSTLQETNQKIAEENKMALSDIETATNNIAKASEVAQEKVTSAIKALTDNFGSALGALQTWDETYGKTIADAIGKNELFIQSLNDVIGKLATIASYEMKDLYDYIDYLSAKGAKGETITEEEWKKLDEIRSKYATNYSKESMAPFDTGGYTGEWGDEGKIAILHEKEYVLNADLTARFFDALKTFSLIESSINAKEQIQAQVNYKETLDSLNHYIDQLANYMNTTSINPNDFSASLLDTGNQQLEQNVHIDANFPNVTSHDEIEMAFDNLVNKASQYINRKNMSSMTFQDSYLSPV